MRTLAIQLSEREIQEEYNISTRTLQGWRTRKKGPPYRKVGGTLVRYDRVEFEAWLQSSPVFLTPPSQPSPAPTGRRARRQTARQSR
jgi:predicted DNA-binding transcriptional regulator AlpA